MSVKASIGSFQVPRSAHLTARTLRNRQSHYRSVLGTDIPQNTTTSTLPRSTFTGCGSTLHTLSFYFAG